MKVPIFSLLMVILIVSTALSQTIPSTPSDEGTFGGGGEIIDKPPLEFDPVPVPLAIKSWSVRPPVTFTGFDESKYGFNRVDFYRWHETAPELKENVDNPLHDSSERLMLAMHLTGAHQDRWFQLGEAPGEKEDLLYIQAFEDLNEGLRTLQPGDTHDQDTDEMSGWLELKLATPDSKLPLFRAQFGYNQSGASTQSVTTNQLLIDLRNSNQQIPKAAQITAVSGGGVCGAFDNGAYRSDTTECRWRNSAQDFYCTTTTSFIGEFATRSAEKTFFLLERKEARPDWYTPDVPAYLAGLAIKVRGNPRTSTAGVLVYGLGRATLLGRYRDVLPNAEIFLFATPAASDKIAGQFFTVTFPESGKPVTAHVPKWTISGDASDEAEPPAGYTPVNEKDKYKVRDLASKAGFHAIQAILQTDNGNCAKANDGNCMMTRVLYWIGLEAANGTLITNSVRLASNDSEYAQCNRTFHDATVTSLHLVATSDAVIHVQPAFTEDAGGQIEDDDHATCAWNGVLRWKPGSGFRVHKTADDCIAPLRDVTIGGDGSIQAKPHISTQ